MPQKKRTGYRFMDNLWIVMTRASPEMTVAAPRRVPGHELPGRGTLSGLDKGQDYSRFAD